MSVMIPSRIQDTSSYKVKDLRFVPCHGTEKGRVFAREECRACWDDIRGLQGFVTQGEQKFTARNRCPFTDRQFDTDVT